MERGENEVQITLHIYNRALEYSDKGIAPDWAIARVVMRSFPKLLGDVEDYKSLISRRSGGASGSLLWACVGCECL